MMNSFFSPEDMVEAHRRLGAACGHGALAAALSVSVEQACQLLEKGSWINVPMMKDALRRHRVDFRVHEGRCDLKGPAVTIVQWLGPWTEPGKPARLAARYRHWVARRGSLIWDANAPFWIDNRVWAKHIAPEIMPKNATGLKPAYTLELF
ncbi:hypothetical protein [Pelagicoccus sp. SDUM812003]|uniref:hypothetical protein n=1 Tax=Pelagicoccus sp. SDUM812003 TaxID=3041267 RepID=UPI00280DFC7E|nr:hypothetical protein [Pelagicoccus sp. SDUM812003]MDQ8205798.1 hypothetical protein [Pelagicoccus sp. SDUM812003]